MRRKSVRATTASAQAGCKRWPGKMTAKATCTRLILRSSPQTAVRMAEASGRAAPTGRRSTAAPQVTMVATK
eukprot:15480610-Alexandrium_andersonii.AAC.1